MSKIDYQDLSAKIMDNIGGVKNVKTVTHCVTRLRFYLHDRNIAEDSEIKKLPGVLGVVYGNGQYQIILGEHLFNVYDNIVKNYSVETFLYIIFFLSSLITKSFRPVIGRKLILRF